jgi:Glycosyl hydrolases family 28
MKRIHPSKFYTCAIAAAALMMSTSAFAAATTAMHGKVIYNVKDFGATGIKSDDARPAIQKAIETAAVKGGTVYLPPGEYTSGTIFLRSHVNLYLEAGATLYASENPKDFAVQKVKSKDALIFGEKLEDISIGGRGTIDGQQKYFWADDTLESAHWLHKMMQIKNGGSTSRSYPAGHPTQQDYPHLLWLGECNNVRITGLSWLHSPSWSFALFACSRVVIDGIYIYTSLKDGVWADGIDIVSCHDLSISNCRIETGDDCIAIVCGIPEWGPDYPTENITITNCRLSSASAGIKFTEGNSRLVQHIVVSNCVIYNTNRGITLQIATGGTVRDVVFSNITMDLHRYDWFWAGDGNAFNIEIHRTSEWNDEPPKPGEPGPGLIKDVIFHDIIVHCQGTSKIEGHPERWLEGITFDNIKFFISSDPSRKYDLATSAMIFRRARNLKLRNIEVHWDKPTYDRWQSALDIEDVDGLQLSGFSGNAAWPDQNVPAVFLKDAKNANVDESVAPAGTNVFLKIAGSGTQDVHLFGNDFHEAKAPYVLDPDVKPSSVTALDNFMPAKAE